MLKYKDFTFSFLFRLGKNKRQYARNVFHKRIVFILICYLFITFLPPTM